MWRYDRARSSSVSSDEFHSSRVRRAMVGLVVIKILGLVVLIDPNGVDPLLVKAVFSAGVSLVLLALLALTLFRFGRSAIPTSPIHTGVAVVVAAHIAAALSAENSYVAMFGERERYLGLMFIVDMAIMYCAIAISFHRAADWGSLALSVAIAGTISVGYAVTRLLGYDVIHWMPDTTLPVGTFGNADALGQFVSIVFGAALGAAAFPATRAWLLRIAAAAAVLISLPIAIALAPRGWFLGFGAVLVVTPLIAFKLRGLRRETIDAYLVRALVVVTLLTGLLTISPLAARVRDAVSTINVVDRALVYESALSAITDRPVFGFGPDSFAAAYPRYRQPRSTTILGEGLQASAQSWPLQTAATVGVLGLLASLILIAVSMRSLWSRGLTRAPAIAAPVLLASVAYWIYGTVAADAIAVAWWPWVVFGTAAALERVPMASVQSQRKVPKLVTAALIVVAVLAALSGSAALGSNRDALTSAVAWREGRADVALAAALASTTADPGRADHWNALGRALELNGKPRPASDAYAEAAARAPYNAAYWSALARSRARQVLSGDLGGGGADAALDAAQRAVAADPNAPRASAVLAEIANASGAYEVALGAAARAIRLQPGEREYEELAVAAALVLSDPRAGLRELEQLLPVHDSATLRVGLAKLSLRLDDRDTARRQAERALELDPRNIDARAILSQTGG